MIAAATFADIMEEAGQHQQLRFFDLLPGRVGDGYLRRLVGPYLTEVAEQKERVLIHGIYMEEVVLDASSNASESGEYARQNATLLHHFEAAISAVRLGENGEKCFLRNGIMIQITRVNSVP